MASPVPVEAVYSSVIINIHSLKQTVLLTTAYTKLCLNPKPQTSFIRGFRKRGGLY